MGQAGRGQCMALVGGEHCGIVLFIVARFLGLHLVVSRICGLPVDMSQSTRP